MRTAMEKRLPQGIASREKRGLSILMKNWIRGGLLGYTYDMVLSSQLIAEYFHVAALPVAAAC